jgi:predicted ArsR family transcriptional regulator
VFLRAFRSQQKDETGEDAARRAAWEVGLEIGRAERQSLRIPPPGPERAMAASTTVLEETGYEPYRDDDGCLCLRSCPFHSLAERDRDLVCGMNERLVEGIVRGLGNETLGIVLDPVPGQCCVRIEPPALGSHRR